MAAMRRMKIAREHNARLSNGITIRYICITRAAGREKNERKAYKRKAEKIADQC